MSRQKVGLPVNELALKLNLVAHLQAANVYDESPLSLRADQGEGLRAKANQDTHSYLLNDRATSPLPQLLSKGNDVLKYLRSLFLPQFWLRPGVITAVFTLLILATVWFVMRRPQPAPSMTAVDVLQRASNAENIAAANTSASTHRILQVEEWLGSLDGQVISRLRVDVWQSAAKGVIARRLYDDRGRLLAGQWTRSDNVTTLYHHGAKPQLQIRNPQSAIRNLEDVWRLSPSAKDFTALIGSAQTARLEEQSNRYVLTFNGNAQTIIHASLILNRDDLHAIEQTLLIQQENEIRAYRIVETSFERRPNEAVAPAVFEPEPELLADTATRRNGDTEDIPVSPSLPVPASPFMATPALEVEVLHLLNQANAFMGEQVSVTHTPEGKLLVSGLVENDQRKAELLDALAAVRGNPAVRIEIETVVTRPDEH